MACMSCLQIPSELLLSEAMGYGTEQHIRYKRLDDERQFPNSSFTMLLALVVI